MNAVGRLFFITLFLLFVPLCMRGGQRPEGAEPRRQTIKGSIVGYSFLATLRMLNGDSLSDPHDEFLFMVEEGDRELTKLKYIKIRYKVTPQHYDALPSEMFEVDRQRSVVLERDKTCDESAKSFIQGKKFAIKKSLAGVLKDYPNLIRVHGMENTRLPVKGMFRCFSFEWDDIEK